MTMTLWAAVLPCLTLLGSTLMSRGACTYSITPGSVTNAAAGATNSVAVGIVAGTGCSWTTANTNPWISILSGASGTGTGTVVCPVQANPNPVGRTGTVTIAGLTLTVRQQALVCAYTLSATSRAHGYSPATNSVDVTANGSGCNWKVTNNNSWITITSPTNNNGSGPVNYTVEVNAQPIPRTGVVMIANQSFTLSQAGVNCNYRLSPITRTHGHAAATNTVAVTSSNGCPWTVINTNTWVILLSPASGTGNATVTYRVTANGNVPDRSGVLTIAGQPFSLVQNGLGCTVSVTPNTRSHGYGTASNGLSVAVNAGCAWAASTTNSWITLVTGATGTGNGTVGYLVAANPSGLPRTGAVVVDDEVLALTQDGAPCVSYELSPDSRTHGHGAATNTVDLATLADCPWNVVIVCARLHSR